jgi:ferrous iron transport protein A
MILIIVCIYVPCLTTGPHRDKEGKMMRNTAHSHHGTEPGSIRETGPSPPWARIMMPLALLDGGEGAEIKEIRTSGGRPPGDRESHPCRNRESQLESMGIRPGKSVLILANKGSGPLLIKIDESRLAVSRAVAMKILVERRES